MPHRGGGGENCQWDDVNIRAEVWKNVIDLDNFKNKCLAKFNSENEIKLHSAEALFGFFRN